MKHIYVNSLDSEIYTPERVGMNFSWNLFSMNQHEKIDLSH